MEQAVLDIRPMLNAYPDSIGNKLEHAIALLQKEELKDTFSAFYILPSIFHSDLDRGFSVIDYDLNLDYATIYDLEQLKELKIDLKLDFILNHASVQSPQFQDLVKNGKCSKFQDFFIDWNQFWEGHGEMTDEGYLMPEQRYLEHMFFRKPGLPILMVKFQDGTNVPYWNTFYQEILEENGSIKYLGQMDLNIKSKKVWGFYNDTLTKLASYGAKIIRLDAFAYAPKKIGEKNFLNEPGTWELLDQVKVLVDGKEITLLPEIHASYQDRIYEKLAEKGYVSYDFFLPGLIIDAIEGKTGQHLLRWGRELCEKNITLVNMLGCHDGIPLLDLKGFLEEDKIQSLMDLVVSRGGMVKNLHGKKNLYYQVNATYFSALGEKEEHLLMARAIQMFMPGKPQVWYLDLFAGTNDYRAVENAGESGHKEINRTNLTMDSVIEQLKKSVVLKQLELIRFRNQSKAFHLGADIEFTEMNHTLTVSWHFQQTKAVLELDFLTKNFEVTEYVNQQLTTRITMN